MSLGRNKNVHVLSWRASPDPDQPSPSGSNQISAVDWPNNRVLNEQEANPTTVSARKPDHIPRQIYSQEQNRRSAFPHASVLSVPDSELDFMTTRTELFGLALLKDTAAKSWTGFARSERGSSCVRTRRRRSTSGGCGPRTPRRGSGARRTGSGETESYKKGGWQKPASQSSTENQPNEPILENAFHQKQKTPLVENPKETSQADLHIRNTATIPGYPAWKRQPLLLHRNDNRGYQQVAQNARGR